MDTIIEANDFDSNYINLNIIESSEVLPNNDFDEEVIDYEEEGEEVLPIDVNSCLLLNNAYQNAIEELKEYLISKRRENESRQNELKSSAESDSVKDITINNCGYTHPNSLIPFMAPYFKDIKGISATPNQDCLDKRRNGEINEAYLSTSKPWNVNEREKLKDIVLRNALEKMIKPLRDQKDELTRNKNSFTKETIDKINELTKKIDQIGSQLLSAITPPERGDQSLDWLKFSTELDTDHSADECDIYWNNYLHPSVNKSEWTKEEDKKLESLVQQYGTRDWDKVSEVLGTGRLAWQCCSRYQMELNRELKRVGPLTKAEAQLVEKVIESCRVGDYIPWHQVSYFIEGRTLPQIKHYWHKINVPKRGDVWTDEENKVLTAAVKKYGIHNWRKVAYFLPGRSNRQCRERYMMRLNFSDRKLGNWTAQEDSEILKLAPKHNFQWVKLEDHIKGRNARQIASRYELLMKYKSNGQKGKQVKNKANKSKKLTRTLTVQTRLYERIRQMINRSKENSEDLDQILRVGRAKLAKKLELECQGVSLQTKGRPKKKTTEENIDRKICEMFALYDHRSSPKKALARGAQDQCVYDTTKQIIKEIITGEKYNSDTSLANNIRLLISNKITSNNLEANESLGIETIDSVPPPIFPPNRTTVKGLRGMLLQTDYLSRKIAKSEIGLEEYSAAVPEDQNYTKLCSRFKSLFSWPALLSLINTPERGPQQKQVNTTVPSKSKRRSWLTTDTSRMIQIRTKQTQLIQTAMQSNQETKVDEELDEEPMNERSTKAPWYIQPKERRYYNLKSLDKQSFVFTRLKPKRDVIQDSDESQKPSHTKGKSAADSSNQISGNSCDEPVIAKRLRDGTSKNSEKNEIESDWADVEEINDVSDSEVKTPKKQKLAKNKSTAKESTTTTTRSSLRIRASRDKAV